MSNKTVVYQHARLRGRLVANIDKVNQKFVLIQFPQVVSEIEN